MVVPQFKVMAIKIVINLGPWYRDTVLSGSTGHKCSLNSNSMEVKVKLYLKKSFRNIAVGS